VRSLGVKSEVNDRNDICVEGYKVSGSAYKIASRRAYHHGTMLISAKLSTLGSVLHSNKDTMITKGVASVRSPVRNLQDFSSDVTHERFVEAMIESFREEYGVSEEAEYVDKSEELLQIPYICNGMSELTQWEWGFGQTPEFTYTLHRAFDWGEVKADIKAKHGVILSCNIETSASHAVLDPAELAELDSRMAGQRYGTVESVVEETSEEERRLAGVWTWLCEEMRR